jgi:hypothetical protein
MIVYFNKKRPGRTALPFHFMNCYNAKITKVIFSCKLEISYLDDFKSY